MPIDIGKLTPKETAALLKHCIEALPFEIIYQTLSEALTTEQKEELGEQWFNIDRKGF